MLNDIIQTQKKKTPNIACFLSHEEAKRGKSDKTVNVTTDRKGDGG